MIKRAARNNLIVHTFHGNTYSLDLDDPKHSTLYTMLLEYDHLRSALDSRIATMQRELSEVKLRVKHEEFPLGNLNYLPGFAGILETQAKYEMLSGLVTQAIVALVQTKNLLPGAVKVDDSTEANA